MEIVQQTGRQARMLPAPVSTSGSAVCTVHTLGTYYVHCSEAPKGLIESVKNSPSCEGHISCKKKPKWTDNKQCYLKLFSCLLSIFIGVRNQEVVEASLHWQNLKSTCYKQSSSYLGDSGVHPHQKFINLSKIFMFLSWWWHRRKHNTTVAYPCLTKVITNVIKACYNR